MFAAQHVKRVKNADKKSSQHGVLAKAQAGGCAIHVKEKLGLEQTYRTNIGRSEESEKEGGKVAERAGKN